jgi:hypothetical protein
VLPPDLKKMDIKIQMRKVAAGPWKTVFWGTVFDQEDIAAPGTGVNLDSRGNTYRTGARVYRCMDGLWRTTKWMMSQSGFVGGGGGYAFEVKTTNAYFNPGYNTYDASLGAILGNKHPTITYTNKGVEIPCHIWQGAYSLTGAANPWVALNKWTEREMIKHAGAANRPPGEPLFQLHGLGALQFDYATAVAVRVDQSVFEIYTKLLSRRRGLGAVWLDWEDNGDELIVRLNVCPLFYEDLTYTSPVANASNPYTIDGADTCALVYQGLAADEIYNLVGDHRNMDDVFQQSDATVNVHDYVETVGERIEIAVTMCLFDGAKDNSGQWPNSSPAMENRYSTTDQSTFVGYTVNQRMMARRYNHVYNLFGLPRGWLGKAGNGFDTGTQRVDVQCADDGSVVVPGEGNTIPLAVTPSGYVELIESLPFYEYYKYDSTQSFPTKTDNAEEYGLPSRRPLQVYLRPDGVDTETPSSTVDGGDYWYLPVGQWAQGDDKFFGSITSSGPMSGYQPTVYVAKDAIMLDNQANTESGKRLVADPVADVTRPPDNQLGAEFPLSRVAVSLTLRLPYPVRFCTTTVTSSVAGYPASIKDRGQALRSKTIYLPGLQLWLASSNCIWDLKQSSYTQDKGFEPMRNALGSSPGNPAVIRDDRLLMQRLHVISANWYMTPRRRIVTGKKFCTYFPYFTNDAMDEVTDPQIGEFIRYLAADGQVQDVNTVVTSQEYNHQMQTTIINTDYFDLEYLI